MSSMNFNFEVKIKSAYEALSQAVNLFQIYLNDKPRLLAPNITGLKACSERENSFLKKL